MTDAQIRQSLLFLASAVKVQTEEILRLTASNRAVIDLVDELQPGFSEGHRKIYDQLHTRLRTEKMAEVLDLIDDLIREMGGPTH